MKPSPHLPRNCLINLDKYRFRCQSIFITVSKVRAMANHYIFCPWSKHGFRCQSIFITILKVMAMVNHHISVHGQNIFPFKTFILVFDSNMNHLEGHFCRQRGLHMEYMCYGYPQCSLLVNPEIWDLRSGVICFQCLVLYHVCPWFLVQTRNFSVWEPKISNFKI